MLKFARHLAFKLTEQSKIQRKKQTNIIPDLNALLVSAQLVLMLFSALLMRLVASLSSCCEANLEFLESWMLAWLSLFHDWGTDLLQRMF